jgi:hypothetical protein
VEDDERELRHAAAVLHFYARQAERGWRHDAVDHDFCVRASARLQSVDANALTRPDRVLLRKVADVLMAAEPGAFGITARGLRRLAGPLASGPRNWPL